MIELEFLGYQHVTVVRSFIPDYLQLTAYVRGVYQPRRYVKGEHLAECNYIWECPGCGSEIKGEPCKAGRTKTEEWPVFGCPNCQLNMAIIEVTKSVQKLNGSPAGQRSIVKIGLYVWREEIQGDA